MTTKNTITPKIAEKIETDMVRGYRDEDGKKQYPTLKKAADWYKVSYDGLKQKARKWNWKQRRDDYKKKVARKVAAKKEEETISDLEAEEIVVEDLKFNKAANKLRRAAVKEIDKLLDEDVVLFVTKEGEVVKGTPKNAGYHLMNLGKALESAQKISKTAAGEPSIIEKSEIEAKVKTDAYSKEFDRIMDDALDGVDQTEEDG